MRILLDENFPLQLHRQLRANGHDCDHVIALGERGLSDAEIRRRLGLSDDLIFVTQDTEFGELATDTLAAVMISRVPQAWPIATRVDVWTRAIEGFLRNRIPGNLFEILPDGVVVAWQTRDL